jgi:hypothetical protein
MEVLVIDTVRRAPSIVIACWALLFGASALAQQADRPANGEETITGYEEWAINLSRPQQIGIAVGHVFSLPHHRMTLRKHGPEGDGLITEAELATGGIKGAIGLHRGAGMGSLSARIAALRTWGNPWGVVANRTYVGPELVIRFVFFRISLGYVRSTRGANGQVLAAFGLGI